MSDRKYKHKGYQDSGYKESGGNRPQGPRPDPRPERMEGAPRGRTAGGFGPAAFKCSQCGQLRHGLGELTHEEGCAKCGADLHTCGNCRFFDTTTTWECRESENIPARIAGKQARNECAMFTPKIVRDLSADKGRQSQAPDDARKAFDALFKK
ncbi:MAG: hypothetical protein ABIO78_01595 [Thermoanaerobaculia bacterium]